MMCPLTLWLTCGVCVLTKLDVKKKKKGAQTRYIHKHQPCAFVIVVVMTKYKEAAVAFNRIYTEIGL